jgi:hypothetical protein
VRDRLVHTGHIFGRVPRRVEKRGRFYRGVARGVGHGATHILKFNGHRVDDETLVARVRSEVLRDSRYHAGEIHIDAYEGCVTLRGQIEQPSDIRRLIDDTSKVAGVHEVRSYLHLPDEVPPNKAEVYASAARSLPSL